jgi:signal transduction histidine kinase
LLYLARLDSGNISIVKKPVKLYDMMVTIKNRWRLQMENKQMIFQLDIPEDTVIQTDFGLLEMMMGNLVSNAVKYGHKQGQLVCHWQAEAGILSMNDNGPGIPKEQLPYIFDRFYRADVPGSSAVQSTGLGLYIVKMLAEIQGIQIEVSSQVNQGTQFFLHFK